jgi:hypothetical protein
MFNRGDVVRTTRDLYHGAVPEGTVGTVRGLREVQTPFDGPGQRTTMAVVHFPEYGEKLSGLGVLDLVRTAEAAPSVHYVPAGTSVHYVPGSDVKARDLAHAHEKVAEAYKALAYALNDLRALEARQ